MHGELRQQGTTTIAPVIEANLRKAQSLQLAGHGSPLSAKQALHFRIHLNGSVIASMANPQVPRHPQGTEPGLGVFHLAQSDWRDFNAVLDSA